MKNLNTYKFAAKVNMANKGISRNGQNKDVYRRTIEIPQVTRILRLIVGSQSSFSQFVQ